MFSLEKKTALETWCKTKRSSRSRAFLLDVYSRVRLIGCCHAVFVSFVFRPHNATVTPCNIQSSRSCLFVPRPIPASELRCELRSSGSRVFFFPYGCCSSRWAVLFFKRLSIRRAVRCKYHHQCCARMVQFLTLQFGRTRHPVSSACFVSPMHLTPRSRNATRSLPVAMPR